MTTFIRGQEDFCVLSRKSEIVIIAEKIKNLRSTLGLRQEDFALRLGLDQTTVSKWERGKAKPVPDALVKIASLAEGVDKLFFLEHAGLPPQYFAGEAMPTPIMEASARVVARGVKNAPAEDLVWVPLFKDAVAAGEPRTVSNNVEDWIPFSTRFLQHGDHLRALRVKGDSMAPIVNDGYVVIVDVSERDPHQLIGKMVAASEDNGVTIKWLRRDKDALLLVPHHVSLKIPVRIMRPEDHWDIVGVVVKWIGYPPAWK